MREVYIRNVTSLQCYIEVLNLDFDFSSCCSYLLRLVGQTIPEIMGGSNEINECKRFFLLLGPIQ